MGTTSCPCLSQKELPSKKCFILHLAVVATVGRSKYFSRVQEVLVVGLLFQQVGFFFKKNIVLYSNAGQDIENWLS